MNSRKFFRKPGRTLNTALRIMVLLCLVVACICPTCAWAGGGKPATKIYNIADTRDMTPGISKWIADLYNSNLWLFGLLVVTVMAGMGLILGFTMDAMLKLLGINLGKLQHHE